jgi:hypothetical protein
MYVINFLFVGMSLGQGYRAENATVKLLYVANQRELNKQDTSSSIIAGMTGRTFLCSLGVMVGVKGGSDLDWDSNFRDDGV